MADISAGFSHFVAMLKIYIYLQDFATAFNPKWFSERYTQSIIS